MSLEKIRKASLHELRVRAAQRVLAFSERRGWSTLVKLPSDDVFANAPHDLLEHFRSRTEPSFFPSFHSPEQTAAEFISRWPTKVPQLIDKADRASAGKFDLLGYTNLSFGKPIDWHFEPLSGKRIPLQHWSKLDFLDAGLAGDKKIIWELNRHQYFMTLGQAYLLTGDEGLVWFFASHLDEWMDANPPKLGINWASSLEVAFRSMSWLWAFYFFKSSETLSAETFKRAWKFLYLSARHLESYLSTYFSPNTHLTGEALGLFYLGTLLPEFKEAKRWQALGRQILIEQLPIHVKRDGVYFEQSSYYHRYTTDFYSHFLLLCRANKIALPREVEETLRLLLDHLMYITRPDGTTPFFGDDDGGRLAMLDTRPANDFRGTLGTGAVLFDRGDYKFVADGAAEELLWLTGAEGLSKFDSIAATEPAKTSVPFYEGGYFVMRDGWTPQSNYLLFDCGPHGALNCGHAHADALSIDVAANGQTVLVDPGTYTYTGSKESRDWFRSSHAHNTLTLDDASSSVPAGPFTWKKTAKCSLLKWISEDRFDFISGQHDGYMPAIVKREILFLKRDYWIIRDTVISSGEHHADTRFHFAPGASLDIRCFGNGQLIEEEAYVSHCYGQKEAAKVLSFSATLQGNGEVISFLLPQKPGTEWSVKELEARQDGRAFEVCGANTVDLVIIPPGDDWAWNRTIDGQVRETILTRINADNNQDVRD